jgi:phosphorylcholine metabolism protein LicD
MGYFSGDVKRYAIQDIRTVYDCAEAAGIREHLFVCFGLLLGIVREKDFIENDDDIDMGIISERISKAQEDAYYNNLVDAGMFFARKRIEKRDDTDRFTWFSLRKRNNHAKFCHWFWLKHAGYYFHTKAGKWVTKRKFGDIDDVEFKFEDDAIMKGIPVGMMNEFQEVDFHGIKVNIPKLYGTCVDFWYPGWLFPMHSKSAKAIICQVPKWEDVAAWKVIIRR